MAPSTARHAADVITTRHKRATGHDAGELPSALHDTGEFTSALHDTGELTSALHDTGELLHTHDTGEVPSPCYK